MNKEGKESRKIHRIELREIFDKEEFKKTLKKRSVEYFCIFMRIRIRDFESVYQVRAYRGRNKLSR